jgi:hypothetical protein
MNSKIFLTSPRKKQYATVYHLLISSTGQKWEGSGKQRADGYKTDADIVQLLEFVSNFSLEKQFPCLSCSTNDYWVKIDDIE